MRTSVIAGGVTYLIDNSLSVRADGAGEEFLNLLTSVVRRAMSRYSPAFGHPLAFAASTLADLVGGTVESVEMEDQPEGLVY